VDVVLVEGGVGGDDGHVLETGLGDEQAIERIGVVAR
jgi:hypothetical protein